MRKIHVIIHKMRPSMWSWMNSKSHKKKLCLCSDRVSNWTPPKYNPEALLSEPKAGVLSRISWFFPPKLQTRNFNQENNQCSGSTERDLHWILPKYKSWQLTNSMQQTPSRGVKWPSSASHKIPGILRNHVHTSPPPQNHISWRPILTLACHLRLGLPVVTATHSNVIYTTRHPVNSDFNLLQRAKKTFRTKYSLWKAMITLWPMRTGQRQITRDTDISPASSSELGW